MVGTIVEKDKITVEGGEASEKELEAYLNHIAEQYPNRKLKYLNVKLDGEYADLSYEFEPVPFERVRRITGYLVGTMDRWNNAKRAEERDRVHHSVSCC
ncbi:MAG: Anaerobic ribonucleoside-triphosphate reductase [Thermocaproicibacter melissae]|jgi:hypothetical protein|uniref:anaerobic ribonucleoside-triphosphate reductase n=1 Tax=Thermocaproicibacter melissae TaxID=2966552 RepID=UPI0024B15D50|nr:anaerobic ribonucleoside-triphosphate reductase [Thermocaproicibacter melissae]WBY64007.1 anaerobic ribonucleoside-triphosphate reductase [Thermocaproicibacter melissae]